MTSPLASPLPLPPEPSARPRAALRPLLALTVTAAVTLAATLVPAPPALAAARVTATPATADPDYASKLRLHGAGFQSVKNGFGGVYVLFGTVSGAWRPSQGGASGVDYVYVQDSETKDNHGYQRFVAFPGDPTAYAANGGTVRADGTWDATLVVPGAVFPAKGRDGSIRQIDCRKVQCGVITIGAHGVANPSNETFTPVDFAAPTQRTPAPKTAQPTPGRTKSAAPPPPSGSSAASTPPATPRTASAPAVTASAPASADDPTAPVTADQVVTADPVVTASSASGAGRVAAIGAGAVLVVTGGLWLLLRRRRRHTTALKEERA